jgi:uncharacterized tellurite resistance protein B-like protein
VKAAYIGRMVAALLRRLSRPAPGRLPEADARLALAALLVRVARSDGAYQAAEAARIDRVLAARHGLSPFAAAALRAEAEAMEAEAPDTVRFTRALKDAVTLDDRAALVQALWAVALADGARGAEEEQVIRMVAALLGLTDRDSALARQRAERA